MTKEDIALSLEHAIDEWENGGKDEFVRIFSQASGRYGFQAKVAQGLGVTRQRVNLFKRGKISLDTAMRAFPVILDALKSERSRRAYA